MVIAFGTRLKELREKKGLSQENFGKIFHLSQSLIAYYESGKKQPSQKTLQDFAEFFKISVDYLLGRTNIPYTADTVYLHRKDGLLSDLPEEARKQIEDYIAFKKYQYGIKD